VESYNFKLSPINSNGRRFL